MKEINKILAAINQKYGAGTVSVGSSIPQQIKRIKSGIVALDLVIGGGIPVGSIIEFYGRESGGKSSTALKIVGEYQRQGLQCAYIDMEHAFDPVWATTLGVDMTKLTIAQPDTLEKASDIVETLTKSGEFDLIVYDSLAASVPNEEVEKSAFEQQMALQARLFSKMCRKLLSALQPSNQEDMKTYNNTVIIFINQVREKVGQLYARGYEVPGGHAIKHSSKMIIEFKAKDHLENEETKDTEGIEIIFTTKKNKTWIPYKVGMFKLYFNGTVDNDETIIVEAKKRGIIKQSGPMYEFKDIKEKGMESFVTSLKEKKMFDNVLEETYKVILKG